MLQQPTVNQLRTVLPKWRTWLAERGAEILQNTNKWELLRFRGTQGTSVVYATAKGATTFTGEAADAYESFKTNASWRAVPAKRTKNGSANTRTLRQRDGDRCFFCGLLVTVEDETIDHLVPVTQQGPNHIGNKVLMHRDCNRQCGSMSATEKIRAHVEWQLAIRKE